MDAWDIRPLMEETISRRGLYEFYLDLCQRVEAVPVTREKYVDAYVSVLVDKVSLYEKAKADLATDKKNLVESLEAAGAPVEDIVTVDMIPPFATVTINEMPTGVICLYVLFPNGSDSPYIVPSYLEKGTDEAEFL